MNKFNIKKVVSDIFFYNNYRSKLRQVLYLKKDSKRAFEIHSNMPSRTRL